MELAAKAATLDVPKYIVQDAGKTQVLKIIKVTEETNHTGISIHISFRVPKIINPQFITVYLLSLQIAAGSLTVLAIIGKIPVVNQVTGSLSLL